MEIKYIYNEKGERESVVIPAAEWERLRKNLPAKTENENDPEAENEDPAADLRNLLAKNETFRKGFLAYADELDRQKRWE